MVYSYELQIDFVRILHDQLLSLYELCECVDKWLKRKGETRVKLHLLSVDLGRAKKYLVSIFFLKGVAVFLISFLVVAQVKIGLRVLTRPMGDRLPQIYRTLGENYSERVLPSIIHETLKAVVAQYNASQLITQREVRISKFFCYNLFCSFVYNVGLSLLSPLGCEQRDTQDSDRAGF